MTKTFNTLLCGALLSMVPLASALAGVDRTAVESRYRADRQACLVMSATDARHACLRDAGAARQEALRGVLSNGRTGPDEWLRNRLARCAVHRDATDRMACERLAMGDGDAEGSVASGAVVRELTVPVPAERPAAPPR